MQTVRQTLNQHTATILDFFLHSLYNIFLQLCIIANALITQLSFKIHFRDRFPTHILENFARWYLFVRPFLAATIFLDYAPE